MDYRVNCLALNGKIRILPPVYLLGAIALMALLHYFLPGPRLLFRPWNFLGLIPMAGGLLLAIYAERLFKRHKTTIRPGKESTHLLTYGPYRFTRNPIYLAMIILLSGIALLLGSLSPWIVLPVFIFIINRKIIPVEEAMLVQKFGAEYEQYRSRVRRWV
jgi:protein-S-isoprenylcysteine O-methyltransferase Ste14